MRRNIIRQFIRRSEAGICPGFGELISDIIGLETAAGNLFHNLAVFLNGSLTQLQHIPQQNNLRCSLKTRKIAQGSIHT